ncbi:hypothetical protein EDD80_11654 [Anseongella ginsenosidimutans]|uniref:Uncharacterized protein n=1 Tax=Anseongella ginsenosidimutans TaxID=496056 RepID=A0A4R3KLT9_9SPHI|nr:hypothetical protein [Anseongella ginsenosidimutans]QEC53816.1 hypothetical protein FRZ59_16735 [Anseongella ginsenosidimutans]TCS84962.1 hypothetical protein EDD80_11654 [Anseongella ginsenosidimutans]
MIRFLPILALLFILASCSENKDCCVIIEPVEDNRIDLWSGEDTLLSLPGDLKAYTVSSDEEEVAGIEVTEEGILISAENFGATIVHASDGANQLFAWTVHSKIIRGDWAIMEGYGPYKNSVIVEAEDADFAAGLREELLKGIARHYYFRFMPYVNTRTFQLDSARFIQLSAGTPLSLYRRGYFSFSDLTLVLDNLDQEKETYQIIPYKDRSILGLLQDLTDYYRDLHPDKGIRKVTLIRHLKEHLPPG